MNFNVLIMSFCYRWYITEGENYYINYCLEPLRRIVYFVIADKVHLHKITYIYKK